MTNKEREIVKSLVDGGVSYQQYENFFSSKMEEKKFSKKYKEIFIYLQEINEEGFDFRKWESAWFLNL